MTDQSQLVSVILPLYNRAESIVGAINSVLDQTYRNLELIVVDDASTDQSIELVEAISDPRIRLLRHETNQGAAAARNTGIEAAKGGYVAFQDSDDEWLPEKLDKQMQVFLAAPEGVGAVYCGFVRMGEREPNNKEGLPTIPGNVADRGPTAEGLPTLPAIEADRDNNKESLPTIPLHVADRGPTTESMPSLPLIIAEQSPPAYLMWAKIRRSARHLPISLDFARSRTIVFQS